MYRCDFTAIDLWQKIDHDIGQEKIKIAYVGIRLACDCHVIKCVRIRLISTDGTYGQMANTTGNTSLSCEKLAKTTRLDIGWCNMIQTFQLLTTDVTLHELTTPS